MLPLIAGYVMGKRAAGMSTAASALGVGPAAAVEILDERLDRTLLVIEALWTLLKEHGYTDEQLAARITQLDEADGMIDGRHVPEPTTCKSCGSKIPAGLPICQFCGTATGNAPAPFAGL